MEKKDYYETLGVRRDGSQDDLKKAFRQLARNIIRTSIRGAKRQRRSLRKSMRPNDVLSDPKKRLSTTTQDTPLQAGDTSWYKPPSYDDLFRDFGLGDIFDAFYAVPAGHKARPVLTSGAR